MTDHSFTAFTVSAWGMLRFTSRNAASCRKIIIRHYQLLQHGRKTPRYRKFCRYEGCEAIDPYGVEYFFEESVDGVVTDSSVGRNREYFSWQENGFDIPRVRTRDKWHIPARSLFLIIMWGNCRRLRVSLLSRFFTINSDIVHRNITLIAYYVSCRSFSFHEMIFFE